MSEFILSLLAALRVFLRSRSDTALEILALRQQLAVLKRKRPRPVLNSLDRLFWITSTAVGPGGRTCSSWSCPKPLPAGTAPGSAATGVGDPGAPRAGHESPTRSAMVKRLAAENPLGSAQDPRRDAKAGLRRLGAERRPVSGASQSPGRLWQEVACVPPEPPRGDRRYRLLHRADFDVPFAVLLLRHRSLPPEDPAFQRDPPPDCGVGGPTVSRSVS